MGKYGKVGGIFLQRTWAKNRKKNWGDTGRHSRQGEGQPFGYTGYLHDEISGT